jgi:rRNA maturation endonuclease Nob1
MTKAEALSKVEGLLSDLFPIEEHDKVEEIMKALEQPTCNKSKWIKVKDAHKDNIITTISYKTVCLKCGCRKTSSYGNFCPSCGCEMIEEG